MADPVTVSVVAPTLAALFAKFLGGGGATFQTLPGPGNPSGRRSSEPIAREDFPRFEFPSESSGGLGPGLGIVGGLIEDVLQGGRSDGGESDPIPTQSDQVTSFPPVLGFVPAAAPVLGEAISAALINIARVLLPTAIGSAIFGPAVGIFDDEEDPVSEIPTPLGIPKRIIRIPERKDIPKVVLSDISLPKPRAQIDEIAVQRERLSTPPRVPEIATIESPEIARRSVIQGPPIVPKKTPFPARVLASSAASVALQTVFAPGTAPRVNFGTAPRVGLPGSSAATRIRPPRLSNERDSLLDPQIGGPIAPSLSPSLVNQATRVKQERCVEVPEKKIKGQCFEGLYREFADRTQFIDWREVNCTTRRQVGKEFGSIRDLLS